MIRKIAFTIAITGTCIAANAQNIGDALRYSQQEPGGSARAQAIGGALGSLGGEYSSMFVNPAGVAFFKTSEAAVTFGFRNSDVKSNYLGTSGSDNKGRLFINSGALIFGGNKVSYGLGINRTANYNQNVYYQGVNNKSSFSDNYILNLSQERILPSYLESQQQQENGEFRHGPQEAYFTYLINPQVNAAGNPNGLWESIVPVSSGIRQENTISTRGGSDELSFALGGNFSDKFYLGGSLNTPIVKYESVRSFRETNINQPGSPLNYFEARENLRTEGFGFNAKIGAIFKPVAPLRLGVNVQTPSWISFTDTYTTTITTSTTTKGVQTASSTEFANGYADESKYNITTPWKGGASATYIFGNPTGDPSKPTGFLTADYEFVNYSSMKMRIRNGGSTDKSDSDTRNQAIKNTYATASNIRVGAELKLNVFAIRAGFANYGNPFKEKSLGSSRNYYSGGLGYRNKGVFVDLAVTFSNNDRFDQPYTIEIQPNTLNSTSPAPASLKVNNTSAALTVGFKF